MRSVNLIPADLRRGGGGGGRTGGAVYIVVGGLVALVAMAAVYGMTVHRIAQRKSDIATVTREAQVAQARAAALQPYIDIQTRRTSRVQLVTQLAKQRFHWSVAMSQIAEALPSDVVLTSLTGTDTPSSSAGGGGGGNGLRSAIGVPAVTLLGCTKSQTGVATMLDSLRNIPGVSVDSLASSDRGSGGSGGAGGSCGGGPTFSVVVFYTNATAPHAPQAGASVAVAKTPGVTR
jgi:Tfp pilus assembly protein PilN